MGFGKRLRQTLKGGAPSSKQKEEERRKGPASNNNDNNNDNDNNDDNNNNGHNNNNNNNGHNGKSHSNGESSALMEQLESLHEALMGIENESHLASKREYAACRAVYKDLQRILYTTSSHLLRNQQEQEQEQPSSRSSGSISIPELESAPSPPVDNPIHGSHSVGQHKRREKRSVHFSTTVGSVSSSSSSSSSSNSSGGGDASTGTTATTTKKKAQSRTRSIGRQSVWDSGRFVPEWFRARFDLLQMEIELADEASEAVLRAHPAATRPLSPESLRKEVSGFFVLDNSLRETTVGAPRGHTLEEKHKIVASLAKTSLVEIILGAYGSKISVCSQIAERWLSLGKSFDKTWGFSECYDLEPFEEDGFWEVNSAEINNSGKSASPEMPEYYTPEHIVKTSYGPEDLALMKKASSGFRRRAFGRNRGLADVLKNSSSADGRIPLGLLMMKGYGICNAILEIDTSIETFDYGKHNIVKRLEFLITWCKDNLAERPSGEPARVLINLRDFSNYHRSRGGLQNCLYLVDALCRLPLDRRPFGFLIEEPTGWLFPSEVGQICRMLKLTMDRAGFPEAKFLIHSHWYFGMAEATQLQALCNGCNGVWGAVCKTGAQTGHACSTMTAVNLYRAGIDCPVPVCDLYNLEEMCESARAITEIVTRKPCDPHEEIYGSHAFDIPYFMVSLPSCRYSIHRVLEKIGVKERAVRLNTLSMVSSIYHAMVYYFGEPDEQSGWKPKHCRKMHDAINNHLLTGLSRDYNSAMGLGHLYGLVSREKLSGTMLNIMMRDSNIPDTHPVVVDFIYRWNRLCELYETGVAPPHPAEQSKSMMFWGVPLVLEPRLRSLPFEFFTADVMRNKVLAPIPSLFKLQVVNLLTNDERKIQGKKIPEINFSEAMLRLKLFLQEADSLRVMGLVDDFCIRKNHDFFFGEDALWLKQMHGKKNEHQRPKVVARVLLNQMKFYHKHYIHQGDTAISRCIEATAGRIHEKRSVPADVEQVFGKDAANHLVRDIAEHGREVISEHGKTGERFGTIVPSHESMLRALAHDGGEDMELARELSLVFCQHSEDKDEYDFDDVASDVAVNSGEFLAEEYVKYRRESLRTSDEDDLLLPPGDDDLAAETQPKSSKGRKASTINHKFRRSLFDQKASSRMIQEMGDRLIELQESKQKLQH